MQPGAYNTRDFALPADDLPENNRRSLSPGWQRRPMPHRRTGSSFSATSQSLPVRWWNRAERLNRRFVKTYKRLSPIYQAIVAIAGLSTLVFAILFIIYHERIFHAIVPVVQKFRTIKAGWLILWTIIVVCAFPPLIGYSTVLTITGIVYGFPNGWFIAASATIVGSTLSFLVSRSLLKNMVHRMIAHDSRFAAISLILKHDGIKLLWMIRLCPLPYSLSNGGIATFPTVSWTSYALATALSTPKLMLHIFVGSRLGELAENGEKMDPRTKVLSYMSMFIGGSAGIITGWYMYNKITARSRELEAEERQAIRNTSHDELEHEYTDDPDALEAAHTLRDSEDDTDADEISLRSNFADGSYHDESSSDGGSIRGSIKSNEGSNTVAKRQPSPPRTK